MGLVILRHPVWKIPFIWGILSIILYAILRIQKNRLIHIPYSSYSGFILKTAFICEGILFVISLEKYYNKIDLSRNKISAFIRRNNFNIYLIHQQLIEMSIYLFIGCASNIMLLLCNISFAFLGSSIVLISIYTLKNWVIPYFNLKVKNL